MEVKAEVKADAMDLEPDAAPASPVVSEPRLYQQERRAFWRAAAAAAGEELEDSDPEEAVLEIPAPKPFRFQAKHFFLTYSQCNLTPQQVWDAFTHGKTFCKKL